MDALPDGIDIKRSLNNWKTYRTQLATMIQGYLATCADLSSICARASRQTYDRKDLESALMDIDAELESLASEAKALRSARTSLAVTRNLSKTLAPIHTLPPEVLTGIFMRVPTHEFTGISSYWRWVALTTPSLWTYLDITSQIKFSYDYLSLERSDGLPLYFYVAGPCFENDDHLNRQLDFFTEASPQISMLDIESTSYNFYWTGKVALRVWLGETPERATKMLRVLVRAEDAQDPIPQWDGQLLSIEHAETALSTLTVLHLQNILIPWSSAAYHNLVDLRLSTVGLPYDTEVSVSQLAHAFASSPGLSILKLNCLKVTPSSDWNATKTTPLFHLEVLCLLDMDDESLELVMRLIPLSRCLGELSIGLNIRNNILPLTQDFLRGSRTKKLACAVPNGGNSIWWPLSLSKVVPSLEHLVIYNFTPHERSDVEALVLELERRNGEGRLDEELPSCVPHVYLVSSAINEDMIMFLTRMPGIRTLHVEGCRGLGGQEKYPFELDITLLEALPDVVRLSTVDTTAQWPCRTMFAS